MIYQIGDYLSIKGSWLTYDEIRPHINLSFIGLVFLTYNETLFVWGPLLVDNFNWMHLRQKTHSNIPSNIPSLLSKQFGQYYLLSSEVIRKVDAKSFWSQDA